MGIRHYISQEDHYCKGNKMNYFVKHIKNMNVKSVLDTGILKDFYALVTCIDSDTNVIKVMQYHKIPSIHMLHNGVENSLIFKVEELKIISNKFNLLNGFDELWCFRNQDIIPKPSFCNLQGVEYIDKSIIIPWMQKSMCVIGIGDGLGLNYITSDENLHYQLSKY